MDVKLEEHVIDKETQWGIVKQSLDQHKVFVKNRLAGYVGKTHFLPLVDSRKNWQTK